MGLKWNQCPNPMGFSVKNNIGSTSTNGELRDRAAIQNNDDLAATHPSQHSFRLRILLEFATPKLSLNQNYVSINDTRYFQHECIGTFLIDRDILKCIENCMNFEQRGVWVICALNPK